MQQLMKCRGIRAASRAKKRFTTRSDPSAPRAADLVQGEFRAAAPNQLWFAVLTFHT